METMALRFASAHADRHEMRNSAVIHRQANASVVGHSRDADSEAAGREAVRAALAGRQPTAEDLVILFTSVDYDVEALYRAAAAEASPAAVVGCTDMGGFTNTEQVPSGCVAAFVSGDERSLGVCHLERDDNDIAGSARHAAQQARDRAGDRYANSVLLLLTGWMTPD